MAAKKIKAELPVYEAQLILDADKFTVRPMEWFPKRTFSTPQWIEFFSSCKIESKIYEDLMFVAQYRPHKTEIDGLSEILMPEIFNAAILFKSHRIFALDVESTPHTNKKGAGRPLHKHKLDGRAHLHTWSEEGYGYAEPIDLESDSIEGLMAEFLPRAKLTLTGGFIHPLSGAQLGFDL